MLYLLRSDPEHTTLTAPGVCTKLSAVQCSVDVAQSLMLMNVTTSYLGCLAGVLIESSGAAQVSHSNHRDPLFYSVLLVFLKSDPQIPDRTRATGSGHDQSKMPV